MINLIPPAAKRKITKEYWTRVLTVWLTLLGTSCLIIALLILPTYILIDIKTALIKEQAEDAATKMVSYDVSATELQDANRQAQILLSSPKQVPATTFISELDSLAGSMVDLRELRFERKGEGGSVTISGIAQTRQSLADLRDQLEADERFANVDLPISSLIKDRDLLFTMTLIFATSTPPSS